MKTMIRLAAITAAMAVAGTAAANVGPYVQADIGLGNLNYNDGHHVKVKDYAKSLKDSYKESGFTPRISAGYDFGNYRAAIDYTHYKKASDSVSVSEQNFVAQGKTYNIDANLGMDLKVQSVGISGIYDFDVNYHGVQPYVGARLGINRVELEKKLSISATEVNNATNKVSDWGYAKGRDTKVGFGAMVGAQYKINDQLSADVAYRYNRIYSDLSAHEVTAGLRYNF